jgi:hypothetical protein
VRPKTARLTTFADAAAAVDVLLAEQSARGDAAEESEDESDEEEGGERGGAQAEEEDEVSCHLLSTQDSQKKSNQAD